MVVPGVHTLEVAGVTELPEEGREVPHLPIGGVGVETVRLQYQ